MWLGPSPSARPSARPPAPEHGERELRRRLRSATPSSASWRRRSGGRVKARPKERTEGSTKEKKGEEGMEKDAKKAEGERSGASPRASEEEKEEARAEGKNRRRRRRSSPKRSSFATTTNHHRARRARSRSRVLEDVIVRSLFTITPRSARHRRRAASPTRTRPAARARRGAGQNASQNGPASSLGRRARGPADRPSLGALPPPRRHRRCDRRRSRRHARALLVPPLSRSWACPCGSARRRRCTASWAPPGPFATAASSGTRS